MHAVTETSARLSTKLPLREQTVNGCYAITAVALYFIEWYEQLIKPTGIEAK